MSKRIASFLLLFLALALPLSSLSSLSSPLLPSPPSPPVPDSLPPIKTTANAVFDRLVEARGDARLPAPELVISKDTQHAVWLDMAKEEIGLERKAYEAAMQTGHDSALAVLLAAPLMYYYENALTKPDTLKIDFFKAGFGPDSMSFYTGAFLAYSAGYGVFEKGPELMSGLYQSYRFKDSTRLELRKKAILRATYKVQRLVEVFETGNFLAATSRYEDAYAYYRYVLKDYQSKETLNNAGVTAVQQALGYFRPSDRELRYRLPLELDLKSVGAKDIRDFKSVRDSLLREAVGYFDAAIQMNTSYVPARLNMACAHALLGDLSKADSIARKSLLMPASPKTLLDLKVLIGVLLQWKGETEKAMEELKSAAEQNSTVAQHNLDVMKGNEPVKAPAASGPNFTIEKIDDWDLSDPFNLPDFAEDSQIEVDGQISFYHNLFPGPNSRYFISINAGSGQYQYFLQTGPGYDGQTAKKLKIGATRTQIVEAYNKPLRSLETPTGQIMVYADVLMILNKEGKMERWALYGEQEMN